MATPKVNTATGQDWTDIIGAAASVAGMTWQNLGPGSATISFSTAKPVSTDARHVLERGQAFYDKTGSAHLWACSSNGAVIAGTAD